MAESRKEKWVLLGVVPLMSSLLGSVSTVALQELLSQEPPAAVSQAAPAPPVVHQAPVMSAGKVQTAAEPPTKPSGSLSVWPMLVGALAPAFGFIMFSIGRWIDRQ